APAGAAVATLAAATGTPRATAIVGGAIGNTLAARRQSVQSCRQTSESGATRRSANHCRNTSPVAGPYGVWLPAGITYHCIWGDSAIGSATAAAATGIAPPTVA